VQEYLRLGAGIDSLRIPSLCLYTKVSVDYERAKQVRAPRVCACVYLLGTEWKGVRGWVGGEAFGT